MLSGRHARNAAIRTGLGINVLPCGCVLGIYETYAGTVIAVLDVKAANCRHEHASGDLLDVPADRIASPRERP